MKTIIAGSRTIWDYEFVEKVIDECPWDITEVVCGMADGVDTIGLHWATDNDIPVKKFPADWDKYGRAAGRIRNEAMADYADALILVWDGESKGSGHMLEQAAVRGLTMHIRKYAEGPTDHEENHQDP